MKKLNKRKLIGWIAVSFSVVTASLWAVWGGSETFHEGWYYKSFWPNIGLTFIQYLSPMLIFMGLGWASIIWPRLGALIHLGFAVFAAWFFNVLSNTVLLFILLPLVGIAFFYWFGELPSRKTALWLMIGIPVSAALITGIIPAYRVSQRITYRSQAAQRVVGNQITLTWSPAGPGWPDTGTTWHEANRICRHLNPAGDQISAGPQNTWRLPTVEEAVHSMSLHGQNSRGTWDGETAAYEKSPDKEYPLWDIYSPIIYYWTASEINPETAYIIVYDGKIWPRDKILDMDYLGFRCVR